MFSIAAKYLARFPDSDMALIRYPQPGLENAASLLSMESLIKGADWNTPAESNEKLHCIRNLVQITTLLAEEANRQGMALSQKHAPCLHRCLDMIEAILASRE